MKVIPQPSVPQSVRARRADAVNQAEPATERPASAGVDIQVYLSAVGARLAERRAVRAERALSNLARVESILGIPSRHNRLAKQVDRLLLKSRGRGAYIIIAASGLWRRSCRVDPNLNARAPTLLESARSTGRRDIEPNALFDQAFYLSRNRELDGPPTSPLAHYLTLGDAAGRSPHPLVDTTWYREHNREGLARTGLTVLQHFLKFGAPAGRDPHPLFSVRHYLGQVQDYDGSNPLVHYLRTGWRRGHDPHPLFDNDWYLRTYPDVARAMVPPLVDYLTSGLEKGRSPHPLFWSKWYRETHNDVTTAGEDPLAHFCRLGAAQACDPNPYFSMSTYLARAGESLPRGVSPLQHFLEEGQWRGLSPHAGFTPEVAARMVRAEEDPASASPYHVWVAAEAQQALSRPTG
jgi:hypothetical protein